MNINEYKIKLIKFAIDQTIVAGWTKMIQLMVKIWNVQQKYNMKSNVNKKKNQWWLKKGIIQTRIAVNGCALNRFTIFVI